MNVILLHARGRVWNLEAIGKAKAIVGAGGGVLSNGVPAAGVAHHPGLAMR